MDRPTLSRFFRRRVSVASSGRERRKNKRTRPSDHTQILVVDDSRTAQHFMSSMLEEGSYETLLADNAESAINLAKLSHPDLIFMDVFMPGINGFQATRKLSKDPDTQDIPVVIVSGNSRGADEFWGKKIGAADFMQKPYSRGELFQRVESLLYGNSFDLD
jgi:twitching motility two-component system response regulator PilH